MVVADSNRARLATRLGACLVLLRALGGCASAPPHVPPRVEARAAGYAARADRAFAAGQRGLALHLATHALVARLAACDGDCPEVARSFVQLGDLRCAMGKKEWAVQSYRRGLGILERIGDSSGLARVRAHIAKCRARRAPASQ